MGRLAQTEGLTDVQQEILAAVREFVDNEIIPVANELEHADEYPTKIVEQMKEMGLFGLMIPEEYGGIGESLLTYALIVEEIARGWMSVSGIINTHFIVAYMLLQHGTDEQKQKYLPRMATGEVRGAFSMSEPGCGSDVPAITSRATRRDDGTYVLNGQKMWLTNGGSSTLVAVLMKTDEGADSVYRNMTTFLIEKEPGFGEVRPGLDHPRQDREDGLQGRRDHRARHRRPRAARPTTSSAAQTGRGFYQMMDGVEVGRVNVAARACGARPAGLRARHRLRPAAQDLRQADRPAPGDAVPARRHGHQGRGGAPDDGARPRARRTPASATTSRPAWPSTWPASTATRWSRTRSASTAATATPRSTRSSASTARRRCC